MKQQQLQITSIIYLNIRFHNLLDQLQRKQPKMLGIEFANGRSSLGSIYKKQYESSSKLYTDKYLKNEPSKINPQQLEKSIQNEIKKARDLLHRINYDIDKHSKNGDNSLLGQLREMQESIRRKNIVIKQIQNEINFLKSAGMKSKNRIDNFIVNISQEIRCNSAAVIQLKKDLDEKRKLVSLRKQEVDIVFQRYSAKFKSQGREVIDFIKFKQIQEKKKRDFQKNDKVKATSKKQMSSIWQDRRQEVISTTDDKNQNKIKDIMNHRNVAEAALKTERKRHRQQMNNCLSKLEFLKGEQQELEQKIKKRELELKEAEERFSDSRTKHQPKTERRFKNMKIKTMH